MAHQPDTDQYNELDAIIAYEQGDLDDEGTVILFQRLIDSGRAWLLQGHYGRTAEALIAGGYCTRPGGTR